MSKYFNKALFFIERTNVLSAMGAYVILYSICLLQSLVNILNTAQSKNEIIIPQSPYFLINRMYSWFIIIAIASIVASYLEKDKKYYYMLTQPYSRNSIVVTKTITHITSFLIPTVVFGIITFIILSSNRNYFENYYILYSSGLFLTLFGLTAVLTFVTVFAQLMQMLFGKAIAGVIFPVILYFMLLFSLNVSSNFISKRLGFLRDIIGYIPSFVFNKGISFVGSTEFKSSSLYAIRYLENPKIIVSIILISISVLVLYVSILLNNKIKAENTSALFLFKFSEKIFIAIFSLAFTIIGSLMLAGALYYLYSSIKGINASTYLIQTYGLSGKETIEQNLYLILNIIWIPLYVIAYKVFSKVMNLRRAA